MPVGHQRINAREPDPNPNITFIRALEGLPDSDQALKILKAIAAQFKPIMKEWGFGVNSLVEHEWNPTFAGRNWNAGEVIELVLRRKDGSFAPYQFLLYVMAHELSHCKEMNHSVFFRRVNQQLRSALASLRAQGYTGDGFWSTGRVLHPAYANAEIPLSAADEPIYTCGGANKKRGQWKRRRSAATPGPSRARGSAVKLGTTGRQTAIPAKAGGRVKRKGAFEGEGNVLSEDPEMSTKGRRAQAKNAVSARAAAAEARLAAEQRAKAAEARARGANVSPDDDKKKVKRALDIDMDGDADGGDLGGWETDEEDKPNVKLEEEEKEWLLEDMREFRESQAGRNGNASASGSVEGKGKEKEKEPVGKKRKQPSSSPSPRTSSSRQHDKSASSPSASSSKKRSQPRPSPPPFADLDDDLTPEERAWLMADLGGGGGGGVKQEESDDEVEIIEAGTGRGKKPRVAYMAMPLSMGGEGGKKGKRKASSDSDDDLPSPSSILLSPPKSKSSSKAATSFSSSSGKAKKPSPLVKKESKKSPHVHFEVDEDDEEEEEEEGEDEKPRRRSSTTSPSKKRGPMKFFSDGSDAFKYAKPTKSVSPSSKHHPRAIHPPSDSDDDEEDAAPRPSSSKAKSKTKVGDAPPAKKPRKERSDKGKKRGPRAVKEDDYGAGGSSKGKATSSSSSRDGGEKKKKGARPAKEPKTVTERYKAELAAKRRASNKELLAEIEEDERREKEEKGKHVDEDEEDQLDWTSDDEPTVKKVKVAAEKALRVKQEKQDVKGKGKARAVDDSKALVMVGLELRAGGSTTANGGASFGDLIRPFSALPTSSSSSPSASKTKSKPRPAALSLANSLPTTSPSALESRSSDSSIASPLTPPPDFDNFLNLSSPSQDALIAKLEADDAHNQRLKARRVAAAAAAKEEEEAAEKALLEAEERAKERIAKRAQEIEKEAATRGETKESLRGRAGVWGRNVFTEGKATEEAVKAGAVNPVARTQLEGLFGVALDGGGAVPATRLMREDAGVPAGMEGKKWRCGTCDFDNVADLPDCEMCGLGGRSNAAKWSDVLGSA